MTARKLHTATAVVCLLGAAAHGLLPSIATIDFFFHDTYVMVSHAHIILAGAVLFGVCAAILYGLRALRRRTPQPWLAGIHFWLTAFGVIALFVGLEHAAPPGPTAPSADTLGRMYGLFGVGLLVTAAAQLLFPLSLLFGRTDSHSL